MNTVMVDRVCRHCTATMRWDADEKRWTCTNRNPLCHHKEFEAEVQNTTTETTCWCPKCDAERQSEGQYPYDKRPNLAR
jgi:hypothetical protein